MKAVSVARWLPNPMPSFICRQNIREPRKIPSLEFFSSQIRSLAVIKNGGASRPVRASRFFEMPFTPQQVFTGTYQVLAKRQQTVLDEAYQCHPERFVQGAPLVKMPPKHVCCN